MLEKPYGKILIGEPDEIRRSYERWAAQPIDQEMLDGEETGVTVEQTTLASPFSVTGSGTFLGRAQRTLLFEPTHEDGWWFDREDLPESLPIRVSVNNVWTTGTAVRNIVLCSGSPHNYMRMVEHIIALRIGMGLDNVMVRMESGDPPLFDRGSMDLVEGVEGAGMVKLERRATLITVCEPVTVGGKNGSFLTFLPAEGKPRLTVDCAVDFRSAIGKQRIVFDVNPRTFRHGAFARTNCSLGLMLYCQTLGKLFADVRGLGYTTRNLLIAGPRRYCNAPRLYHHGKSLEAAWHRATLDLLAAVALLDRGRFVGRIISYKSGHALDVQMVRALCQGDLFVEV
jgi:UDP-3-O-acyl-N-acetylglucosamine deacetylase